MPRRIAALLLVAACGAPATHTPDAAVSIDASADASADAPDPCAIQFPEEHHASGAITTAQTWGGNRVHILDGDVTIEAAVTIEHCARIEVPAGGSIELRPSGTLQPPAGDTSPSGITFGPKTTAWSRVRINGGAFLLNGATIEGAGLQAPAALTIEGGTLSFQGLTIQGATGLGLLVTGGTLAGSSDLVIAGAGASAVSIPAQQVGTLPLGGYTGNAHDEILVPTGGTVSTSQTWRDLGVPYHLTGGGYLKVAGASAVAVLTIAPGTTLAFDPGAGVQIDPAVQKTGAASGALHAVGLAAQPIVFTSAATTPASGDWEGLFFGGALDPSTQLDQVHIAYAGGPGGGDLASCPTPYDVHFADDAAIRFLDGPMPAQSFVTNTTIEHSAKNGIDRSFALTQAQTPAMVPDFTATNTFVDVPQCEQTHTRAFGNTCPATPQCD
jgi:hypothetical protein